MQANETTRERACAEENRVDVKFRPGYAEGVRGA